MSRTWGTRSLAALKDVHPDLRRVFDRVLQEAPFDIRITEGLRTVARQKQLVAIGASTTMKSRHITGHAVDVVPLVDLDGDGKIELDELYNWLLMHKLAPVVKRIAKEEGVELDWGGDWQSFPDGPHYELDRVKYPA